MGGSILEDQERARYQVKAFAAVNSISDGIITVDNQRLVIFMNKAAEDLTGWKYRSEQELRRRICHRECSDSRSRVATYQSGDARR
jgi:PAS domain-containing protein